MKIEKLKKIKVLTEILLQRIDELISFLERNKEKGWIRSVPLNVSVKELNKELHKLIVAYFKMEIEGA